MGKPDFILFLPASFEVWVLAIYGAGLLFLAKFLELLALLHFRRANRLVEAGFTYDHGLDRYRCPEGSHLEHHAVDLPRRLAVYRAPASHCNCCRSKHTCTPHDNGRHIYRSLAVWSETDLCRFHQHLSATMLAIGALLSLTAALYVYHQPGWGLLAAVAVVDAACLVIEIRRMFRVGRVLAALERETAPSGPGLEEAAVEAKVRAKATFNGVHLSGVSVVRVGTVAPGLDRQAGADTTEENESHGGPNNDLSQARL